MMNSPALVVDFHLDSELVESITLIRRLRLANLRSLLSEPENVQKMLKNRGLMKTEDSLDCEELKAELLLQLAELEKYERSENIYLDELENYLEILGSKGSSRA